MRHTMLDCYTDPIFAAKDAEREALVTFNDCKWSDVHKEDEVLQAPSWMCYRRHQADIERNSIFRRHGISISSVSFWIAAVQLTSVVAIV